MLLPLYEQIKTSSDSFPNMIKISKYLLLVGILVFPAHSFGQMFSVNNQPERISTSNTTVRLGTAVTSFLYQGLASENPNGSQLELDNTILVFGLESSELQVSALIGNRLAGIKEGSFFDLNLRFTNSIPLNRGRKLQIGIPIQLATGITTSNSEFDIDRFNQTIFAAGTGASVNYNITQKTRLRTNGIAGYGFSNSNGGFFGGSLFYANGIARLDFLNLFGTNGISIGYDYSYKSFDIDVETYDYDLSAHLLTIGLIF